MKGEGQAPPNDQISHQRHTYFKEKYADTPWELRKCPIPSVHSGYFTNSHDFMRLWIYHFPVHLPNAQHLSFPPEPPTNQLQRTRAILQTAATASPASLRC